MTEQDSIFPNTLAEDVVAALGLWAQEQGTTLTEQLRLAYETQVGSMATNQVIKSDLESPEEGS